MIPLLFETGCQQEFDATICVACSTATQLERLRTRGWSPEQIQQRIAAQWPTEEKMKLADYVLWTEGDFPVLESQLDHLFLLLGDKQTAVPSDPTKSE